MTDSSFHPNIQLNPEFSAYNHTTCPEALTDLYTVCEKLTGKGCKGAVGLQFKERSNVLKRQHMVNAANSAKMGQKEWYKMYVRLFHRELA